MDKLVLFLAWIIVTVATTFVLVQLGAY